VEEHGKEKPAEPMIFRFRKAFGGQVLFENGLEKDRYRVPEKTGKEIRRRKKTKKDQTQRQSFSSLVKNRKGSVGVGVRRQGRPCKSQGGIGNDSKSKTVLVPWAHNRGGERIQRIQRGKSPLQKGPNMGKKMSSGTKKKLISKYANRGRLRPGGRVVTYMGTATLGMEGKRGRMETGGRGERRTKPKKELSEGGKFGGGGK